MENKDWTGNSRTNWSCLGASNHSDVEREQRDYYATSPIAIDRLLAVYDLPKVTIHECASGESNLANRLRDFGYSVIETDIIQRGSPTVKGGIDFLTLQKPLAPIALTNPPFKFGAKFCEHGLDIGYEKVIMFMRIQMLEGIGRKTLFDRNKLEYVIVARKRITCAMNNDQELLKKSSAACYCWYIFNQEYNGKPQIMWM